MNKRRKILWNFLILAVILGFITPNKVSAAGNDLPRVMVVDYELEEGGISPGEMSQLTVTLKNMNTEYSAYSVLVTCQSSSTDGVANVSPIYGDSNQAYVDSIGPNEEKQVVISLQAADTLAVEQVGCTLNISFKDDTKGNSSTDTLIYLPIKQDYLKIQRAYVPKTAVIDTNFRISVTCENIINEEIYNAVMKVKGSGMEETSVDLGTVLSGSRKNKEVYLAFNSVGEQSISVEISYEDAKGNSYTSEKQSYQVEVSYNTEENLEIGGIQGENTLINVARIKQAGCILAIVLCIIGVVIVTLREKKH